MERNYQIQKALEALEQGQLVGLPTETVYGLAAPIHRRELVEKIFALKERPFFDPLIVHVSGAAKAAQLVTTWPGVADLLARHFWPGPLTIVLPKNEKVSDLITSGLPTVGLRCPDHPVALELMKTSGFSFAAPSANKFKRTSPTTAEHVREEFGDTDVYVLEGGDCRVGIESTIVKIDPGVVTILRPGMITREDLESVVGEAGYRVERFEGDSLVAPGQMADHYQPAKPLYLVLENDSEVARKKLEEAGTGKVIWLDLPESTVLAARVLYSSLRQAARLEGDVLALQISDSWKEGRGWSGLWDRLSKASSHILS